MEAETRRLSLAQIMVGNASLLSVIYLATGVIIEALRQKDDGRAREELAKAVELDPTHAGAHLALADALVRSDQLRAQAVEHYQWFLRLGASGADQLRVKRALPNLKKKLALR